MANYDLKHLDIQHEGVYRKCTDLLQAFMDRQCQLRKLIKENGRLENVIYEQNCNAEVISFIQWVRYHLWGNDDKTIEIKTHITHWTFRESASYPGSYHIKHSPFACNILGIDSTIDWISAREIVEAILEIITPHRETSIFAIDEHITNSITLKTELDRIKKKINDPIY